MTIDTKATAQRILAGYEDYHRRRSTEDNAALRAELEDVAGDIAWDAESAVNGYVFKMEVARMCVWRDRIRAVAAKM